MFVEQLLPVAREGLRTVGDDASLIDAAGLLRETSMNLVVVCNGDGVMTGVITKTDVMRQISHCQGSSCRTAASVVMSRQVTSCRPEDALEEVWSVMKARGLKHLPVIAADGRPVGTLNARTVVEALLVEVQSEEALLRDYVMCVGFH